jgi:non-heme chloroperoxidase
MNSYECVKSLSESDFTEDLERFDVPTLLFHGEATRSSRANSMRSARLLKIAKDIYHLAAPHGFTATHQAQVNADLLAFLQS